MEKTEEIKLKHLIGSEYPLYGSYLFFCGGVFIVSVLHLYRSDRILIAAAVLGVSLFLTVIAYRRTKEVVNGSVRIAISKDGIVVKSPLCDKGDRIRLANIENLSVEVAAINQRTTDGISKYYKVCINGQSVFRSKKLEIAGLGLRLFE
jgi:hypothetical protein